MDVSAFGTVAVADKIVSKHWFWNTTLFFTSMGFQDTDRNVK